MLTRKLWGVDTHCYVLLAGTLVAAFNLATPHVHLVITVLCAILVGSVVGIRTVLISLAIFGAPVLNAMAEITGVSVTVMRVLIGVFLLAWLLGVKGREAGARPGAGAFAAIVWCGLLVLIYSIDVLFSESPSYAAYGWSYLVIYVPVYLCVGLAISRGAVNTRSLTMLGGLWIAAQYPLMDMAYHTLPRYVDTFWGLRVDDAFDPIETTRAAGALTVLALAGLCLDRQKSPIRIEYIVPIFVSMPIVFYSYTRQVYLAVAIAGIILLYQYLIGVVLRRDLKGGVVSIVLFFLGGLALLVGGLQLDSYMANSRLGEAGMESSVRLSQWSAAWEMIKARPLEGYGVGAFAAQGYGPWPHNIFLEAWLEHGLAGFLLIITGCGAIMTLLSGSVDKKIWGSLGCFYLLVSQFSADIPRNSVIVIFASVAFVFLFRRQERLFG